MKEEAKERYMSRKYISKDGFPFRVIKYYDDRHMRIRFDDGYELNTLGYLVRKENILRYTGINKPRNTIDFDEWVRDDITRKNV